MFKRCDFRWFKCHFFNPFISVALHCCPEIVNNYPVLMMKSIRCKQQQLSACIAILAVLLLFIAPVVSKNLAERHDAMTMSGMSADMPMMDHHSDMAMTDHSMMNDGLACGYCDLLVHVPLMLWVFIPFIWLICLTCRAPPPRHIARLALPRLNGIYRPRAPPLPRLFISSM
ncbi:hypothetical protein NB704_003057 [Pantoea ananatis]|nr:hypothetical protein [Pantoea ananatis]